MKMLIQDLDAKGGQLKETGEKLALTSARWLQANIYEEDCPSVLSIPHVRSLEQTKADLMESMGESRKRKDEIEVSSCFLLQMSFPSCEYVQVHLKVLNGKLRSEKAECAALQARFS